MTAKVVSTYNRHSQVVGGLEIPCKLIFTAESAPVETLRMLLISIFLMVDRALILFLLGKVVRGAFRSRVHKGANMVLQIFLHNVYYVMQICFSVSDTFVSLLSDTDLKSADDSDMNGHYPTGQPQSPTHYPVPPCPREMYGQGMYSTIYDEQVHHDAPAICNHGPSPQR